MTDFIFAPNWRDSIKQSIEYQTSIIESRDKTEQRIAERETPRVGFSFSLIGWQDRYRAMRRTLAKSGDASVRYASPVEGVRLASGAPAGATNVTVEDLPPWLTVGAQIGLTGPREIGFHEVTSISGSTLALDPPLTAGYPVASLAARVYSARLASATTLSVVTRDVGESNVTMSLEPGTVTRELTAAALTHNGRPVLTLTPNWSENLSETFTSYNTTVDYGYGVIETITNADFMDTVRQWTFLEGSQADIAQLVDLFWSMKGRQGEFCAPSWQADIIPADTLSGNTLVVAGTDFAAAWADDPIYSNIAVWLTDGSLLCRKIASIVPVSGNSIITLSEAWPRELPQAEIAMVSWLHVCRFATDNLEIEWITAEVAQSAVSIRLLKDL